jgi:hypothetical protein
MFFRHQTIPLGEVKPENSINKEFNPVNEENLVKLFNLRFLLIDEKSDAHLSLKETNNIQAELDTLEKLIKASTEKVMLKSFLLLQLSRNDQAVADQYKNSYHNHNEIDSTEDKKSLSPS